MTLQLTRRESTDTAWPKINAAVNTLEVDVPALQAAVTILQAAAVLQVVGATTNTEVSVASITWTDTGLTASITPSSTSSRVLVIVSQSYEQGAATVKVNAGIRLLRDATVLIDSVADGTGPYGTSAESTGSGATSTYINGVHSAVYLDSPASASALTYKTQARVYSTADSAYIDLQKDGAGADGRSSIVLIEIAGA